MWTTRSECPPRDTQGFRELGHLRTSWLFTRMKKREYTNNTNVNVVLVWAEKEGASLHVGHVKVIVQGEMVSDMQFKRSYIHLQWLHPDPAGLC